MPIYAIHSPPIVGDPAQALNQARLVKSGFSIAGLVFGPLWLAAKRQWLPLGGWVAGAVLVGFLASAGLLTAGGVAALYVLSAFLIGVEGRHWISLKSTRAGLLLADIVEARDEDEAARVFFERVMNARRPQGVPSSAPMRENFPIIGLFPEAQRR
jgi:hypothetical protein